MFVAINKKVFIATVVLAGITVIFCCLGIIAAGGPQCAGHELMTEYRPQAFVGLVVWSGFMAFMVSRAAWPTLRNRERLKQSFEKDVQFTYSFLSFEMTDGVLTAYVVLFFIVVMSVAPIWIAATHYLTILNDCQLVTVPH